METSGGALPVILASCVADVAAAHAGTGDAAGTPAATVIMTHLGNDVLEHLVLGDSTVILSESAGLRVITDRRIDEVAADERKAMEALPTGSAEHQAAQIRFVGL